VTGKRFASLLPIMVGAIIFWSWGMSLSRSKPLGGLDFRLLYDGTLCLLAHHDPYNPSELGDFLHSSGAIRPSDPDYINSNLTLFTYLPTTFTLTAPFTLLPWNSAYTLWLVLIAGSLILSGFLMGDLGKNSAPMLAACLIGFMLANSEISLGGANGAGLVLSFSAIAVWCFFRERFAPLGIFCLAVSLAIKPHDAGLVWLYFLLVGGKHRKRALQTLVLNLVLGLPAILWVGYIAPHWMQELKSTTVRQSAHGGGYDPGIPPVVGAHTRDFEQPIYPGMVINLQTAIAPFRDDSRFYNPVTYAVCFPILLIWVVVTLRTKFSQANGCFALAAVVPLTMLVSYHRTTDAKLLLIAVPACALLWAEGGAIGWLALLITTAAILITADIPLAILGLNVGKPDWSNSAFLHKAWLVVTTRPIPLVLLVTSVFYLWIYARSLRDVPAAVGSERRRKLPMTTENA
jgi:hypothetical protein